MMAMKGIQRLRIQLARFMNLATKGYQRPIEDLPEGKKGVQAFQVRPAPPVEVELPFSGKRRLTSWQIQEEFRTGMGPPDGGRKEGLCAKPPAEVAPPPPVEVELPKRQLTKCQMWEEMRAWPAPEGGRENIEWQRIEKAKRWPAPGGGRENMEWQRIEKAKRAARGERFGMEPQT